MSIKRGSSRWGGGGGGSYLLTYHSKSLNILESNHSMEFYQHAVWGYPLEVTAWLHTITHPGISRLRETRAIRAIWCFPRIPRIPRIPRNPTQSSDIFSNFWLIFGNWGLITRFLDFFSSEIFLKVNFGSKFWISWSSYTLCWNRQIFRVLTMQNLEISSDFFRITQYLGEFSRNFPRNPRKSPRIPRNIPRNPRNFPRNSQKLSAKFPDECTMQ